MISICMGISRPLWSEWENAQLQFPDALKVPLRHSAYANCRVCADFRSVLRPAMGLGSLFRAKPKASGKILVAFASQTGAAERIAWLSANALAATGAFVRVAALGGLGAQDLAEAGTLLIVTSTYGAGESPDSARAFVKKQMAARPAF